LDGFLRTSSDAVAKIRAAREADGVELIPENGGGALEETLDAKSLGEFNTTP